MASAKDNNGCLSALGISLIFLIIIGTKVNNVRETYRDFGMTGIVMEFFGFELERTPSKNEVDNSPSPQEPSDGEWLPVSHDAETWYLYSKPEQVVVDEEAQRITYHFRIKKGDHGKDSEIIYLLRPNEDILWATGSDPDDWKVLDPGTLPQEIFKVWYEFDSGEPSESITGTRRDPAEEQSETVGLVTLLATPIGDNSRFWTTSPLSVVKAPKNIVESINDVARADSYWYWDQETGRTWVELHVQEPQAQKIVGLRLRVTVFEDSTQEDDNSTEEDLEQPSAPAQASSPIEVSEGMLELLQSFMGPNSRPVMGSTYHGVKKIFLATIADEPTLKKEELLKFWDQFFQEKERNVYEFELYGLCGRVVEDIPIFVELEGLVLRHGGSAIEVVDVLLDDSEKAALPAMTSNIGWTQVQETDLSQVFLIRLQGLGPNSARVWTKHVWTEFGKQQMVANFQIERPDDLYSSAFLVEIGRDRSLAMLRLIHVDANGKILGEMSFVKDAQEYLAGDATKGGPLEAAWSYLYGSL